MPLGCSRADSRLRCDLVSAGCVRPSKAWLDALSAGGRLVFPLTAGRNGVILKVVRGEAANVGNVGHTAQFVCPCGFIPAEGIQDADEAARLADAFGSRDPRRIRSLRFGDADPAREDCWYRGNGWWLSTEP
jgi:protein-L-isoaspartate(D-aspartate) O-methyltransferase